MAFSAQEQELYDWLKSALPRWMFEDEFQEVWGAVVKGLQPVRAQVDSWIEATYILDAVSSWLDLHAKDRGTFRQALETDALLQARLRTFQDMVTRPAIIDAVEALWSSIAVTPVAMVELRRDRAYLTKRAPRTGTGGEFVDEGAGVFSFTPDAGWQDGQPPYRTIAPTTVHKLVISGAIDAANDGTFTITGMNGDAALFTNAGVAVADAGVSWRVDTYDVAGNLRTAGTGRMNAYVSRGYRVGGGIGRSTLINKARKNYHPCFILILASDATAATQAAAIEAVRQRKAAGVHATIERRL